MSDLPFYLRMYIHTYIQALDRILLSSSSTSSSNQEDDKEQVVVVEEEEVGPPRVLLTLTEKDKYGHSARYVCMYVCLCM